MIRILFLLAGLFLFGNSVFLCTARAEEGIRITPMMVEVEVFAEDERQEAVVTVENTSEEIVSFQISALDFGSLDESGGVAFLGANKDLEERYSLASWMRPEANVMTLAPESTQTIRVFIENRPALPPGGHYGALLFDRNTGEDTILDRPQVAVHQILSVLFFVKKRGGEIESMELKGVETDASLLSLPQKIRTRFQNTGNVHVVPRGEILLVDPLRREVGRGALNEESGILLPESFRVIPNTIEETRIVWVPGWYTLKLGYRFDGQENFSWWEKKFFYAPPWTIVLVGGFLVGGILRYRMRRMKE